MYYETFLYMSQNLIHILNNLALAEIFAKGTHQKISYLLPYIKPLFSNEDLKQISVNNHLN